jgi:hypothetical protein
MKMYKCSVFCLLGKPQWSEDLLDEFSIALFYIGVCSSVVVETLCYKPIDRVFEIR